MDFLEQLGLEIPEQQTRTSNLHTFLEKNPKIKIGFDSCCYCAKPLTNSISPSVVGGVGIKQPKSFSCKQCHGRVNYCSKQCREKDTIPNYHHHHHHHNSSTTTTIKGKDNLTTEGCEDDNANGHGPVICSLLRLCDIDEKVEQMNINNHNKHTFTDEEIEASKYRIQSEYESYPASLANILLQGPCYQETLKKLSSSSSSVVADVTSGECANRTRRLVIHIIGASEESELWGGNNVSVEHDHSHNSKTDFRKTSNDDAYDAYSSAMTEILTKYPFDIIHIYFVGPNFSEKRKQVVRYIRNDGDNDNNDRKKCKLILEINKSNYNAKYLNGTGNYDNCNDQDTAASSLSTPSPPDIVMFFNPGFTCPDYDWMECLNSILPKIPILVTTNTEMEVVADCRLLWENGYVKALPEYMLDIIYGDDGTKNTANDQHDKLGNNCHDELQSGITFFGENPYAGIRIRQSGNMANDVFLKNRWMFGGIFDGKSLINTKKTMEPLSLSTSPNNNKKRSSDNKGTNESDVVVSKKKHKYSLHSKKNKKKNFALM